MSQSSHLEMLFEAIDEGYCLCEMIRDADGQPLDYRFIDTNPLFEQMTGLHDATGRTALELVPGLERAWIDTYDRVARGETMRFQNGSDVMGRHFDVFATPVAPEGRFALVFRDISGERELHAEREDAITRAENLLTEFNHRVMNTLATITAIVRMEARALDGPAAAAMARVQTRLWAVTTLYRALNRSSDMAGVIADQYLGEVAQAVADAMADRRRITIDCQFAPVPLPPSAAAPLAMLLNELMTNALKYAFPQDRMGTLAMRLTENGRDLVLEVQDDGIGKQAAADADPDTIGTGVGATLIEAFVIQLRGALDDRSGQTGTHIVVTFPNPALPPAMTGG